jgi:hypothetical protein
MEAHVITTLKLAGVSALLSAGLVTGFPIQGPQPAPASSGKLFQDRVTDGISVAAVAPVSAGSKLARIDVNAAAKSDRVRTRPEIRCTDGAWVLVPADCVPNFDASSARTSEVRTSANNSSLVRDGGARVLASR